jgi:diaminopimelate epimerase
MQFKFEKYEGAGNDFVLIDMRREVPVLDGATIARLCDRHFGIGADGLITLDRPVTEGCDCSMRYYNADGSAGEMCGNGGRCFTLFAHRLGIGGRTIRFDSIDGVHEATVLDDDRVELGMIDVDRIERSGAGWSLNTGVPQYVELVEDIEAVDVTARGREIRHEARFPEGTNVNFVCLLAEGRVAVRTYERGVEAETLACGTGATASALVAHLAAYPAVHRFKVTVRGGELEVVFNEPMPGTYTNIRLSGPAHKVFEGNIRW